MLQTKQEQLEKISIPTMIVQGDRDDIKISHAEYLYKTIPQAQLCILPNTSHLVFEENAGLMCGVAVGFF